MESASGGDDRKDSLFDIAPRSALSSRQSSEEDAFFVSILALGDGDHDFLRDGDHDLPGCTLQHLQDTWIGSDLEPAFGMNDTWQGATGEQTHVDDEGTRDGDSKPDPGDPAHFDETDREEAARLIATRTQLLTVLPAPALPLVVQFLFSSNRVAGMNAAQAERMTALALGVDEQELRQWRATSSTTVTLASGPPSMFSGTAVGAELVSGTQTSSIAESNTTTGSTTYVPSLQRTWLLHDYPELHAKAQEYVDEGFRGQSDRPRPFKITEFQSMG